MVVYFRVKSSRTNPFRPCNTLEELAENIDTRLPFSKESLQKTLDDARFELNVLLWL
jgi:hypothetical protein